MIGRETLRKKGTQNLKCSALSLKHGGDCVMACMAVWLRRTGSLVFTDDVTADRSFRINSVLIFSQKLQI